MTGVPFHKNCLSRNRNTLTYAWSAKNEGIGYREGGGDRIEKARRRIIIETKELEALEAKGREGGIDGDIFPSLAFLFALPHPGLPSVAMVTVRIRARRAADR
ncbi:hypothetical protein CDAR_556731 [Caerostris darwini]|uniref:Uncharacterized protein n=1 Tax=Caerostris darwini TaxID=1538125 RepID=A0AAV4WMG2_9ARAC|nr:hypothetical protein CDAR_556731 [Caerostris darwini]